MEDVRNETNEFTEPYPQVVNQATGVSTQTPPVEPIRSGDRHSGSSEGRGRQSIGEAGEDNGSPWLPLHNPIYRSFWIASFVSNVGTWMHEIGAGWLMTDLDASPQMVSAVRTAMATPIVLLAIPAGVLADRVDRRRLLLATQVLMLLTAASLAALTAAGVMTSWLLLGLTFLIGLGLTLHVPTWQASIPELVPRPQLSRAIALGSINFNLARSAGPAIAGALVAIAGSWIAFSFNAISFAGVIVVLLMWRRQGRESSRGLSYRKSLYQGLRYVYRNHQMRHVLVRLGLFVVPASALWGLLPLVARQRLDWGADGFGVLVTCVGGGALIGLVYVSQDRFFRRVDRGAFLANVAAAFRRRRDHRLGHAGVCRRTGRHGVFDAALGRGGGDAGDGLRLDGHADDPEHGRTNHLAQSLAGAGNELLLDGAGALDVHGFVFVGQHRRVDRRRWDARRSRCGGRRRSRYGAKNRGGNPVGHRRDRHAVSCRRSYANI